MKILALQLKRIGDLILTTPALAALQHARPEAQITLAVHASTWPLLPAIPNLVAGIVFGPGRGWTPWQQTLTGPWDAVLDFTGSDRSAFAVAMSRAPRRLAFTSVRKHAVRALAYTEFSPSAVREFHTADHYAHLVEILGIPPVLGGEPRLQVPELARAEALRRLREAGVSERFVLVHPGTARAEKYWLASRWAEVCRHLREELHLDCVLTGRPDPFERAHLAELEKAAATGSSTAGKLVSLAGSLDLPTLAALAEEAALVVSCDTAIVHLAAAFRTPQVALFGPTNPFHWRPRHPRAVILSAAQPEAPLTEFDPLLKGAPMDRLSTGLVIRAIDSALQMPSVAVPP